MENRDSMVWCSSQSVSVTMAVTNPYVFVAELGWHGLGWENGENERMRGWEDGRMGGWDDGRSCPVGCRLMFRCQIKSHPVTSSRQDQVISQVVNVPSWSSSSTGIPIRIRIGVHLRYVPTRTTS